MLTQKEIKSFQSKVLAFFEKNGRSFPWRTTLTPYAILVSELMLQQTQTDRVIPKFLKFIKHFPNFETLAQADLKQVLTLWSGLGYNRRALFLKKTAEIVVNKHNGVLPITLDDLQKLPGIGVYTSGAICAFAYNRPVTFVETNIRTVFIHEFFKNSDSISDKEILPIIEQTVDYTNPRLWYWALMDYGAVLKKEVGNLNTKSKHYTKQSKFEGSNRQIRGLILKTLVKNQYLNHSEIAKTIHKPLKRVKEALQNLENEGLIKKHLRVYSIL